MAKKNPPRRRAMLVASGDMRESANLACWPAQAEFEASLTAAFADLGWSLDRAPIPGSPGHGFIRSQAMGRDVFEAIPPAAPLVVAEAAWQYSHHVLIGLARHKGPILIAANWSGRWPGLVGGLNLRACLTKAGVPCSFVWTEDAASPGFREQLAAWTKAGRVRHDLSHVRTFDPSGVPGKCRRLGRAIADAMDRRPAIMGVFDEGCMGMENAIIPDEALWRCRVFKERLSQSALYAAMRRVPDAEADAARRWLDDRGVRFVTGSDESESLTDGQVRDQLRMYIAAARMADEFGCDAIGIQYQQGLMDLCPASDLAEGLLNASDRPPVAGRDGRPIRDGQPILHFNEADECAGLDAILTREVWSAMGLPPDTTLHDLRWGDWYTQPAAEPHADAATDRPAGKKNKKAKPADPQFIWVFEISGAAPATHFEHSYAEATSDRQPPMYFRLGGGTLKGISKPGEVVWSRIFVQPDAQGRPRLHMDIGRCSAVRLPTAETDRRWRETTPQWPIMHARLYGIDRDQMMARHQSNHVQVVYAPDAKQADRALSAKAVLADALGIRVHLCGDAHDGRPLDRRLARL